MEEEIGDEDPRLYDFRYTVNTLLNNIISLFLGLIFFKSKYNCKLYSKMFQQQQINILLAEICTYFLNF